MAMVQSACDLRSQFSLGACSLSPTHRKPGGRSVSRQRPLGWELTAPVAREKMAQQTRVSPGAAESHCLHLQPELSKPGLCFDFFTWENGVSPNNLVCSASV